MTTTKRRLTVSLNDDDQAALKVIASHLGTTSASAAVRRAVAEFARQIDVRRDRASRLPQTANEEARP